MTTAFIILGRELGTQKEETHLKTEAEMGAKQLQETPRNAGRHQKPGKSHETDSPSESLNH